MIKTLYTLTAAAAECGIKRTTLASGMERGEIKEYNTGCGLRLVKLAEARKWAAAAGKRSPGRPRNK